MWFQKKIHTTPTEEISSSRGDGGGGGGGRDKIIINIPNFPGERGCTKGKCFQWALMACKRVTKDYRKDSCISRIFLLKFWVKNRGFGLYTRPLI